MPDENEKSKFHAALGRAVMAKRRVVTRAHIYQTNEKPTRSGRVCCFSYAQRFWDTTTHDLNAAKLALTNDEFKKFKKLRDRCDTQSQFRNAFVHFTFINIVGGNREYTVCLSPNPWNLIYKKPKAVPEDLTIADINAALVRFNRLSTYLRDFAQKIPQRAMKPQAHIQLIPMPNHPHNHQTQTPKSRRHRQRSSPS